MNGKITRSRNGCQKCKKLKIKCDEQKPSCGYCCRKGLACDYSKKLIWGGRPFKDNRVVKCMRFENTSFVEGICSINLKSRSKVEKKSKTDLKKTISNLNINLFTENLHCIDFDEENIVHVPEKSGNKDCLSSDSWHLDQSVSVYEGSNELTTAMNSKKVSTKNSCFYSPLPLTPCEDGPSPFLGSLQMTSGSTQSALGMVDDNGSMFKFDLFKLQMPSLLPELFINSPEMVDSFDFFLNETAPMLVPAPKSLYKYNPFFSLLPSMAMNNKALMNMLLVFGANHKNKILLMNGSSSTTSSLVASDLLTSTFSSLLNQLSSDYSHSSDSTLATVLLLAGFDIFFSDKRQKWRTHVYGARKLMQQRFSGASGALLPSECDSFLDSKHFLLKWFAYVDIVSSLSSTNFVTNLRKLDTMKYEVAENNTQLEASRKMLRDIEYFTGMEVTCLSMLGEVSSLINEKETGIGSEVHQSLLLKALELDHKIITYLNKSEAARNLIYEKYYKEKTDTYTTQQYNAYRTLRATNQIFALTAVLQLKRRVLGISPFSPIIKDLVANIGNLIKKWIEFGSSAETCILFCIFCVGCELIDFELESYRPLFQDHFSSLVKKGVASAGKGREIMEDCWSQGKQWWDILKERNLDVTFAL